MNYDKALDILMPLYHNLILSTYTMREIENMMIMALVRKGAKLTSAKRWVNQYLGDE